MDPIRQRLQQAALEEQTPLEFFRNSIARSPLLIPFAGFCAGLIAANRFGLSFTASLVITALCLIGYIGWVAFLQKQNPLSPNRSLQNTALGFVLLFAVFAALGVARMADFTQPGPDDIRHYLTRDNCLATIRAKMISSVRPTQTQHWAFEKYTYRPKGHTAYIRITHILTKAGTFEPVSGKMFMRIQGPARDLNPGDRFKAYCRIEQPSGAGNQGQFDFKQYLAKRNIHTIASVDSMQAITRIERTGRLSVPWLRAFLRHFTRNLLDSSSLADPVEKGLLQALLLGTRQDISYETMEAFRRTGLAHFISLSGMHLGLLFAFSWYCAKLTGLSKRPRALLCAAIILVYIFILPPRAPTLRAAVICLFYCTSIVFVKRANSVNTLCLEGLCILLIRPGDLFSAGFQLSFSTVLGILFLYSPIDSFLGSLVRTAFAPLPQSKAVHYLHGFVRRFMELMSVGLAAYLGGLGVLLWHFHAVTPFSALWTVLAFPIVTVILIAGALKILLTPLLPTIAMGLSWIAGKASSLLIAVVSAFDKVPFNYILIGAVPLVFVIVYYLLLAVGLIPIVPFQKRRWIFTALAVLVIASLSLAHRSHTHPKGLEISVFDVGKGQCIFINHAGEDRLLFDTGSVSFADPARRVILPCLRHRGISKIDAMFLSHDDIDHINAAPELIAEIDTGLVCLNASFLDKAADSSRVQMLLDAFTKQGIPIEPEDNYVACEPLKITPLWPDERTQNNPLVPDNDKSQVILLEYAGRKILLTGDIERPSQTALLEQYPDLIVDILVMPHHGSMVNRMPDFHQRLGAKILLISCGQSQYRNTAIKKIGDAEVFYTAVDGSIQISISPEGKIAASTFRD